jgi:hypothetical protein
MTTPILIKQLSSGYWHIRRGPNEWAQVPTWPPTEAELRTGLFDPGWNEPFRRAVMSMVESEMLREDGS